MVVPSTPKVAYALVYQIEVQARLLILMKKKNRFPHSVLLMPARLFGPPLLFGYWYTR